MQKSSSMTNRNLIAKPRFYLINGRLMVFLSFCLIFSAHRVFTQTIYSSSQLLQLADTIGSSAHFQANLNFLTQEKQNLALVNEIELRTETDELDLSRQEYLMRLSLSNRKSRQTQNAITQTQIQYYQQRAAAMEAEEVKERYESLLTWHKLQTKAQYIRSRLLLLADQKTVYQNQLSNSSDFEISDLLKIESEIQSLERESMQLQKLQEDLADRLLIDNKAETPIELNTEDWISFSTMRFVLNNIEKLPNQHPLLAIQQTEVDLESLNLDLEVAEGKQILDFVQLKYSGRESLTIPQEFSLGLGVRIPTKATNRQKVNEAQLDLFDEEFKQRQLEEKIAQRLRDYYQSYQQLEMEYQMLVKQIEESDWEGTLATYQQAGIVSPLSLLQIKETLLKQERSLFKLEAEAREIFIKILAAKGLLNQAPRTNYLSDKMEVY